MRLGASRSSHRTSAGMLVLLLLSACSVAWAASAGPGRGPQHVHPAESSPGVGSATGEAAFAAIQEVVAILEQDPETDWSRVDIGALREHLVDMHWLTIGAVVDERAIDNGLQATVSGEGRTLAAIQRMVPAHAGMLESERGWDAEVQTTERGAVMTVTSIDPSEAVRIQGLGFFGLMVTGTHHAGHHLMIARGQAPHR